MGNGYLSHFTFTLFKFTLKNFIFLEMVSDTMVSPSIFLFLNMISHIFASKLRYLIHNCINLTY